MEYSRTQTAWLLDGILYGTSAILVPTVWLVGKEPVLVALLLGTAVVMLLLALAFHSLTVQDEGDWLAVRFGPLPLFSKRIPYSAITAVEPGRTSIIDGWGIHYVPGRGWTYNLWGFGCVKVCLGKKVIRIGSDDVDNLASFLRRKISRPK